MYIIALRKHHPFSTHTASYPSLVPREKERGMNWRDEEVPAQLAPPPPTPLPRKDGL